MEWLWYKALGNSMQLWHFCMHRFVYMFMCRGCTGIHLHICKSVWRPKDQMSSLQWDRPCFQMSLTGLEFVKLLKLLDQWTQRCAYLCVPSKFLPLWQVILVWALGLQLSFLCFVSQTLYWRVPMLCSPDFFFDSRVLLENLPRTPSLMGGSVASIIYSPNSTEAGNNGACLLSSVSISEPAP